MNRIVKARLEKDRLKKARPGDRTASAAMTVLVDSDVLIEVSRGKNEDIVARWIVARWMDLTTPTLLFCIRPSVWALRFAVVLKRFLESELLLPNS